MQGPVISPKNHGPLSPFTVTAGFVPSRAPKTRPSKPRASYGGTKDEETATSDEVMAPGVDGRWRSARSDLLLAYRLWCVC